MMQKIYLVLSIIITIIFLGSCNDEEIPTFENVGITITVNNLNGNSANLTCNLTNTESLSINEYGFCWNDIGNPTTDDLKTESKALSSISFNESILDLDPDNNYFIKAYIIIKGVIIYSEQTQIRTTNGLAELTTTEFTEIGISTAICGGNITTDNGFNVTARGVCWNTNPNPTISNNKTIDGLGIGTFTSNLTGLTVLTTYYVRAYATNKNGTNYGNEISFVARKTLKDYDGNIYGIVTIGNQTWMAENLNVTHYADGTEITLIESFNDWRNLTVNDRAYCNFEFSVNKYEALYNLPTAMHESESSNTNPSNAQGVCPDGWHLPSDAEWKELEIYLGMSQSEVDLNNWRGSDEGTKLKATSGWILGWLDGNGTNTSGFTAIPRGVCNTSGNYANSATSAWFWSSTAGDSDLVLSHWTRSLSIDTSNIHRQGLDWRYGLSVRCVED